MQMINANIKGRFCGLEKLLNLNLGTIRIILYERSNYWGELANKICSNYENGWELVDYFYLFFIFCGSVDVDKGVFGVG
jgi:hypothetical protein